MNDRPTKRYEMNRKISQLQLARACSKVSKRCSAFLIGIIGIGGEEFENSRDSIEYLLSLIWEGAHFRHILAVERKYRGNIVCRSIRLINFFRPPWYAFIAFELRHELLCLPSLIKLNFSRGEETKLRPMSSEYKTSDLGVRWRSRAENNVAAHFVVKSRK